MPTSKSISRSPHIAVEYLIMHAYTYFEGKINILNGLVRGFTEKDYHECIQQFSKNTSAKPVIDRDIGNY